MKIRIICIWLILLSSAIAANVPISGSSYSFTAQTATGATDSVQLLNGPVAKHTVQLSVTGSPTTCTYRLEGSLDGTDFYDLSGTQTCTSSTMFHVVDRAVKYVRGYLISLGGGSAPGVTLHWAGSK